MAGVDEVADEAESGVHVALAGVLGEACEVIYGEHDVGPGGDGDVKGGADDGSVDGLVDLGESVSS